MLLKYLTFQAPAPNLINRILVLLKLFQYNSCYCVTIKCNRTMAGAELKAMDSVVIINISDFIYSITLLYVFPIITINPLVSLVITSNLRWQTPTHRKVCYQKMSKFPGEQQVSVSSWVGTAVYLEIYSYDKCSA